MFYLLCSNFQSNLSSTAATAVHIFCLKNYRSMLTKRKKKLASGKKADREPGLGLASVWLQYRS